MTIMFWINPMFIPSHANPEITSAMPDAEIFNTGDYQVPTKQRPRRKDTIYEIIVDHQSKLRSSKN